jgi:hypothetical protein
MNTASVTALAKPSKAVRGITANVRDHLTVMQRAQDRYFAALKRAEADYFEAVQRATDAITGGAGEEVEAPAAPAAEPQAPPAPQAPAEPARAAEPVAQTA